MNRKWPWYTEWQGIFMPVGDAVGLGCALMLLSILGYAVYLFFKFLVEGVKSLGKREWGKALALLLLPGFTLCVCLTSVAAAFVNQAWTREIVRVENMQPIPFSEIEERSSSAFCFGSQARSFEFVNASDETFELRFWGTTVEEEFTPGERLYLKGCDDFFKYGRWRIWRSDLSSFPIRP